MKEDFKVDPTHRAPRSVFRTLGPLLLGLGVFFMIIGLIDFFRAFGGDGRPRFFWCFFIGIPLLGLGSAMTQAGYAGRILRYMAEETAPVAKDTLNYLANETQDGMRKMSQAVGAGLGAGLGATLGADSGRTKILVHCHKCNQLLQADARFCDQCGSAQTQSKSCPNCSELNDPDARFCDNCGKPL